MLPKYHDILHLWNLFENTNDTLYIIRSQYFCDIVVELWCSCDNDRRKTWNLKKEKNSGGKSTLGLIISHYLSLKM